MSVVSSGNTPPIFDLKSATLTLVAVQLKTTDIGVLRREFAKRYGNDPQVFENDPVVIDLSLVEADTTPIDFPALVVLLQSVKMQPIAVKGGSDAQMEAALEAGLTEAPANSAPAPVRVETQVREVIHEVIREVSVPGPVVSTTALLVDRPLRSGQQVYAKDADLVVLAMVNPGAEVIADGSIHVYAPLRGKAIAGARGNTDARIFTTSLEAELLSIAGTYRTSEVPIPAELRGKPAQIRLEGEKLVMEAIKVS
ncbi:MAG: minC [Rhizobacter sp.]|nr:minC [Rhizobacter sp.]